MHRPNAIFAPVTSLRRLTIGASVLVAAVIGYSSFAQAQSCQELWLERNSYYKQYGYCFKTPRAIAYFGNAGCTYDDEGRVPLPRGIRHRVAEITRIERALGCNF